jgi:hypothetical protein
MTERFAQRRPREACACVVADDRPGGTRLSNQGDGETEATERVSALADTASNAPLKTDASYRERHEVTGVLLRAAEEATFAEARSYAGRCYSCAAANDVLTTAAHLTDQCAHCSTCVLAETLDTGRWSITAPSSVLCSSVLCSSVLCSPVLCSPVLCSAVVGLGQGGNSDVA